MAGMFIGYIWRACGKKVEGTGRSTIDYSYTREHGMDGEERKTSSL